MSQYQHHNHRRAGVIFWLLLALMVIIAILALVLDGGRMLDERRRVQAAADTAALAAAAKLRTGYCWEPDFTPDALAAGKQTAAANGYDDGDANTKVTVNIPPTSGAFAGKATYAEVIIESTIAGTFGAILTQKPLTVRGRAVAQSLRQEIGLFALKALGKDVLAIDTDGQLEVRGAPIWVNSSDPLAYRVSGTGTVMAEAHEVVGGITIANTATMLGSIKSNLLPKVDPLICLPIPVLTGLPVVSSKQLVHSAGELTLQPGVYRGGIRILDGDVLLQPGVYVMDDGGFQFTGSGSLEGEGVTLINTGTLFKGEVSLTGATDIALSAPKSGPYAGIAFTQPLTVTEKVTIANDGSLKIDGIVYAPSGHIEIGGTEISAQGLLGRAFVGHSIEITRDGNFRVGVNWGTPSSASVRLVE